MTGEYVTPPHLLEAFAARLEPAIEDMAARREALLREISDADDVSAFALLRETVLATGGCWLIPQLTRPGDWPASHLGEISVLGVFAAGKNAAEIVDAWRRAARDTLAATTDEHCEVAR
jgi:hypothetical protein